MRVRISTTVDATRLEEARRRNGGRDSDLLDAALLALLDTLDLNAEMRAIGARCRANDVNGHCDVYIANTNG